MEDRIMVQEIGVKGNKIVYWQIQWDQGLQLKTKEEFFEFLE